MKKMRKKKKENGKKKKEKRVRKERLIWKKKKNKKERSFSFRPQPPLINDGEMVQILKLERSTRLPFAHIKPF